MPYNFTRNTQSFYIHWPFCSAQCAACPAMAPCERDALIERYRAALSREIEQFLSLYSGGKKLPVRTLYIGGGIPSCHPLQGGLDTPGILSKSFDFKSSLEVSVEVSPGTLIIDQLVAWKACGINRISFGVHNVKDMVLQSCIHLDSPEFKKLSHLFNSVAEYFENISVDLLLGMPNVSFASWQSIMRNVVTLPITHLSIYFADTHDTSEPLLDDETIISLYEWTVDFLREHGFERYELSNFCKPGFASKHHEIYWDHVPYKSFGLGAASFDGASRFINEHDLVTYIESIDRGDDAIELEEQLTLQQIHLETLMVGLRREKGVAREDVVGNGDNKKIIVQALIEKGLLRECDGRLMLTSAGLMLESEIIAQLVR